MHKINSRQASLLLFLMLVSLRLMYLPAYLSSLALSDTYVVVIFGVVVEFLVFIWFMWLINKYKDVTFYELMCKKCGKFVAKLLIIIIINGNLLDTAVAISLLFIPKLPSPAMFIT